MNSSIRKATEADLELVLEMTKHTIDKCYRSWLGDRAIDEYLDSGKLDTYVDECKEYIWLFQVDSTVVAYAICIENMIDFMLVEYKHQEKGIGTNLLRICEEMLFEDYTTISMESYKFNANANSFLRANGWVLINEYTDPRISTRKLIYMKKLENSGDIRTAV